MSHNTLLDIRDVLNERQVILFFNGHFSKGIVREFGDAVNNYITSDLNKDFHNKTLAVFSMFIEQIQNIKKYCESKKNSPFYEKISFSGVITIEKSSNNFYISSGNYIETKDAKILANKIDAIKDLDKILLKKLYKEQVRREVSSDEKDLGLGFIDMARKSSEPIKYWILDENDNLKFFLIEVVVKGGQ